MGVRWRRIAMFRAFRMGAARLAGFASEEFCKYYSVAQKPIVDSAGFCNLEVGLFTTVNLRSNFG